MLERYKLTNKLTNKTLEAEYANDGRDPINVVKNTILHRANILHTFAFTDADEVEIVKLS